MNLLILHFSDIHFKVSSNSVLSRLDKIQAAVRAEAPGVDVAFIAVTGDIAHSGKPAEYQIAQDFFHKLKEFGESVCPPPVNCIFVPGNHDCDFDRHFAVRQAIVAGGPTTLQGVELDPPFIEACTEIQYGFFEFLKTKVPTHAVQEPYRKLHYRLDFPVRDKIIRFECYNTAWVSQRKEIQGQLFYPMSMCGEDDTQSDLVVSLFHHPYNWLEAENARAFRKHVERTSDIILTGHEHESAIYQKSINTGEKPRYAEGAVLQSDEAHRSGFNVITVDLAGKVWRANQYEWRKADRMYVKSRKVAAFAFERSKHLTDHEFDNTKEFGQFLSDAGAAFTHPKVPVVRLDDIFVYPSFEDRPLDRKSEITSGSQLFDYVVEHRHLLIIGSERAGKTALCKKLYRDLQQRGIVPVLLSGDTFRSHTRDSFMKVIHKSLSDQYGQDSLERYEQLDLMSKVLIVDDFHKAQLNPKGRNVLLGIALGLFGRVILFADDLFELGAISHSEGGQNPLLAFRRCVIRQLGHARRAEMIEKWYSLGEEYTGDEQNIAQRVAQTERIIDTLLGRDLLPAYPIFILTLLQSIEARTPLNTASGSYGYIYEVLITAALSRTRSTLSLDTQYTYISSLAYHLFRGGRTVISEDEMKGLSERYFERYKIHIETKEFARDLEESLVLMKLDGGYRFKYRYLYYYFVAKYVQENLKDAQEGPSLRAEITGLTNRVHNEDAANILIFFLYLTKDPEIITTMLSNAKIIFADQEPCNMGSHVSFILGSRQEPPRLAYHETNPKEIKAKYLRDLDEAETLVLEEEDKVWTPSDERELDEMLKINVAFKTVQIMGQILRNFPGSLRGDLKLDIARESYLLGLRSLNAISKGLHLGLDHLKKSFAKFLRDERGVTDELDIQRKTDSFCFWLGLAIGSSVIKLISYSVGSDQLRETYRELMAETTEQAFSLVDISIKLDHIRPIPHLEIIELSKRLNDNLFALTILKGFVLEHVYLNPINYRIKHKILDKLDIPITPRAIEAGSSK